ncbi:hypothetical protein AB3X55_02840 [Alphaproteobacteria bacterium LSUCC0719]
MPKHHTARPGDYIDFDAYPLDGRDPHGYAAVIRSAREQLAADGCCVLPGFIRTESLPSLVAEADSVAGLAHRSFNRTNAYFSEDDPDLPLADPRRRFYDRSNAFVPADSFGTDSGLRAIYEYAPFQAFIREALAAPRFYRYADPLADVIINVVEEGQGFPWHFDTNNFTVTLAIQNGEAGGMFEYAPGLRSAEDECFDAVAEVLDDQSDRVKSINLVPGDLQIFKGRYSLHRVTPVTGTRRRYVGIFSFVETEGMVGSVERTKQLYGRVLPIHLERAGMRGDSLKD